MKLFTLSVASCLVFALAFLLPEIAFSQKNVNKARSAALRQHFKEGKIVGFDYLTSYTFNFQKDNLIIEEAEEINMIALEGNVSSSREVYYHDHVSIVSAEVQYTNGKGIDTRKTCGNYEVEDIFYSDAKVCSYP